MQKKYSPQKENKFRQKSTIPTIKKLLFLPFDEIKIAFSKKLKIGFLYKYFSKNPKNTLTEFCEKFSTGVENFVGKLFVNTKKSLVFVSTWGEIVEKHVSIVEK